MLRPWKLTLGRIDPGRAMPLYLQIVHAVIHEVERGRLPPGAFLPSSRALAVTLGVNRKTVVLAYENLIAQGWLDGQGTRGTVVSDGFAQGRHPVLPPAADPMCEPVYRFRAPPERPLALAGEGGLKLDEGAPDGRLFPPDILARAYRAAVRRASRENRMQYRDPRGLPRLREAVAVMLRGERGLAVSATRCASRAEARTASISPRARCYAPATPSSSRN